MTGIDDTASSGALPPLDERPGYRLPIVYSPPPFLATMDADLQQRALAEIRTAWAHHSTAIEGNVLTLEQTETWLKTGEYRGLPPHQYHEVGGQAEALDMLWTLLDRDLETRDLLAMHEILLPPVMRRPVDRVGKWKNVPNGILSRGPDGRQEFHMLIEPEYVPRLMEEFVEEVNSESFVGVAPGNERIAFSRLHLGFVNVHPFFDGNGRMARMIANIPLLRSGLDPVMIPIERREAYMASLQEYRASTGAFSGRSGIWPAGYDWPEFERFCEDCVDVCDKLLRRLRQEQQRRHGRDADR